MNKFILFAYEADTDVDNKTAVCAQAMGDIIGEGLAKDHTKVEIQFGNLAELEKNGITIGNTEITKPTHTQMFRNTVDMHISRMRNLIKALNDDGKLQISPLTILRSVLVINKYNPLVDIEDNVNSVLYVGRNYKDSYLRKQLGKYHWTNDMINELGKIIEDVGY